MAWKVVSANRFMHGGKAIERYELVNGNREALMTYDGSMYFVATNWGKPSNYTLDRIIEVVEEYRRTRGWVR